MNGWSDEIHALAASWTNAMWRASWQGGAAIVLVWLVCRAWPRMPSHAHCWLWRLAYLRLFVALFRATPLDLAPSFDDLWTALPFIPGRVARSIAAGLLLLWLP